MWSVAIAVFAGCKVLAWSARSTDASLARSAAFFVAWPGLDARAFTRRRTPHLARPRPRDWLWAFAKTALGATLLWFLIPRLPDHAALLRGWVGMVGLVTIAHFGAFDLLSCAWRAAGVDAQPLMRNPAASTSLAEFWGKRWNTAFRDLTHRFVFRPARPRLGANGALTLVFVGSGIVHELVISMPARGGYGGPLVFFVLQAAGLLIERAPRGPRGRAFTYLVVLAPAFLLFHPPFVRVVILPFLAAIGAH